MVESPLELSVVVVVPHGVRGALERWQDVLRAPVRGIELLLVEGGITAASGPPGTRFVAADLGATVPRLRALGLRAARGDVVAFGEAFLRPVPGWAEAFLAAHRRTSAMTVGGSFSRAAGRARDWALTFVEYGRFLAPGSADARAGVSLANVSFKRAALLGLIGEAPCELVEPELEARLRAAGESVGFAGEAVLWDENARGLRRSLVALLHHGRFYGARRVERRGPGARFLRFSLAPLVPALQLARVTRAARGAGLTGRLLRALPPLVLLLCAWALGEALGSLCGEGPSGKRWR